MGTLKPQTNGPLCSNTVIGTLVIDGWAVTFGTARRGLGGLAVPNVTAHPSTASVPTSYYLMWYYNYLRPLKVKAHFAAENRGNRNHEWPHVQLTRCAEELSACIGQRYRSTDSKRI